MIDGYITNFAIDGQLLEVAGRAAFLAIGFALALVLVLLCKPSKALPAVPSSTQVMASWEQEGGSQLAREAERERREELKEWKVRGGQTELSDRKY